ncbi:MAG: cysJ [Chlamydiales bacterium]|nr:cysJ [Chlamydiales bacterium]
MSLPPYDKDSPMIASLKARFKLTKPGSTKNTQHVILDLEKGDVSYQPGYSVGVFVENEGERVDEIIEAIGADPKEVVVDPRTKEILSLRAFLLRRANLNRVPASLLRLAAEVGESAEKRSYLEHLLSPDEKTRCMQFLQEMHVPEFVHHFLGPVDPLLLVQELAPMLPRFYSIASSMRAVGQEVHLMIKLVEYELKGALRRGVASHYLLNLAPIEGQIPLWIQSNEKFHLPKDPSKPIIMIGPGTGVAPFRAFLQERVCMKAPGKNWLFFGECNRETDFFYEEFFSEVEKAGMLKLTTAFSRDQAEKVYVQHRLLENSEEIWRWILEGACIYICGDAKVMAREVQESLLLIFQREGDMDLSAARAFLKHLRAEKRYQTDVY